jgi:hypothetical protein
MNLDLVLLMLNVVRRLAVMCSAGDGARPFREAVGQLLEAKEKTEKKVEKAAEDLQRECLSHNFDLCSV